MPPCFASGCKSGYSGAKINCFRPSEDVRDIWINRLRKIRSDTLFNPMNRNHVLCAKHFQECDIIKHDKIVIKGRTDLVERLNWKLMPGAVPTIFPTLPSYRQEKPTKKRKSLEELKSPGVNNTIQRKKRKREAVPEDNRPENDQLINMIEEEWSKRPVEGWLLKRESEVTLQFIRCSDRNNTASVKINIENDNATHQAFMNLEDVTSKLLTKTTAIADDVIKLIAEVDKLRKCPGVDGYGSVSKFANGIRQPTGIWVSSSCSEITIMNMCVGCRKLEMSLRRKYENQKSRVLEKLNAVGGEAKNAKKMKNKLQRKIRKLEKKNKELQQELSNLNKELKNIKKESLETALKNSKLPPAFQCAVMNALKLCQAKGPSGVRYSMDWLLECTLLRIKSPAAYRHLREAKLLPLPHHNTIQKLLGGMPCQYGVNDASLEAIQKQFKGKPRRDRQGSLVFDEIQLRETLDFNRGTMKFDGYVDFGEYDKDIHKEDQERKLADHALVLMYRPFNASWVQPIAAFATRGAATAHQLNKVVISSISKLEGAGAEVLSLISDGAKPNKGLWKLLLAHGTTDEVKNKIPHPVENKKEIRYLYLCCDVPHLFKCIRNHFRKYVNVKFNDKDISFYYYESLFKEDQKRPPGLRQCFKLSKSHIWPNSFEKMKVRYATQLFSRRAANGLKFYREENLAAFRNSEATEDFTRSLNDLFDALNGKDVKEGLTLTNTRYEILQKFLGILSSTKVNSFASPETLKALRMTITSVMDIAEFLIESLDYKYVLTQKLNQDCLEKFFGLIRSAGGCEDHPTVSRFIQVYRLLSFYTPCKTVVRGNIGTDEVPEVLKSFGDCLRERAKQVKRSREEWRSTLLEKLKEKFDHDAAIDLRGSKKGSADALNDNLIYHVLGFVLFKQSKFISCEDCKNGLETKTPKEKMEAHLTNIMEFAEHSLKYPSDSLFSLFRNSIECKVSKVLLDKRLYGDILMKVFDSLPPMNTIGLGCKIEGHAEDVMLKLIPYYVQIRFYFFVRTTRNDIGRGKATKNKRKLSKLQSK